MEIKSSFLRFVPIGITLLVILIVLNSLVGLNKLKYDLNVMYENSLQVETEPNEDSKSPSKSHLTLPLRSQSDILPVRSTGVLNDIINNRTDHLKEYCGHNRNPMPSSLSFRSNVISKFGISKSKVPFYVCLAPKAGSTSLTSILLESTGYFDDDLRTPSNVCVKFATIIEGLNNNF